MARAMAHPVAYPMAHPKFCNFTKYEEKNNYLRVQIATIFLFIKLVPKAS